MISQFQISNIKPQLTLSQGLTALALLAVGLNLFINLKFISLLGQIRDAVLCTTGRLAALPTSTYHIPAELP